MKSLGISCLFLLLALLAGCGHEQVSRVGLMSLGNLEGKIIPDNQEGRIVTGESCAAPGFAQYYLSDALRDAVKGTEYDTLLNVELTAKTGLFVPSNCITVKGTGIDSRTLKVAGGKQ